MTKRSSDWAGLTPDAKRRLLEQKLRERAERSYWEWPLSPGQRALWFVQKLAKESPAFNVIFAAKILSPVDLAALRTAFRGLVARHPPLRATFPMKDGEPIARIEKELEIPFDVVDAARWSEPELVNELRAESERPFDLASPSMRVRFYSHEPHPFLVATFHHIVMDGWSLWLFLSELSELYQAAKAGRTSRLSEPRHDFRDFLRYQEELLSSSEGERQRAFWLEELRLGLPALNLPTDKVRPPVQRYRGASHRFALDEASSKKLRALLKSEGATLPMGLLTLFQMLLFRYTRQEMFPVGTLSSGRTRSELEDIVGYLANPLVLRAEVQSGASFRTLLKRTRERMLDAFDHQDYPFPLLVESLAPERDPSRSPLFQVLFVFEKPQRLEREGATAFILGETGRSMELGDLALEPLPFTAQHEGQFDLVLLMSELDGKLAGYFDFSEDLFEAETIGRLTGHFETLVAGAVESPDQPVSRLSLLTGAEERSLAAWNETDVDYPLACLHRLFETHVERDPDAVAVVFEGEKLNYGELNERANRLAHTLLELGIEPDVPVALSIERSFSLVVGMLGIMKAGGAYLPIDPSYPAERRAFMLEDSNAPVLLTQVSLRSECAGYRGRILCLDAAGSEVTEGRSGNPESGVGPSNLAYVIYTSGSTGRPKGVLVEHRGLSTLAGEQQRLFGVGPGSRVLQFSSMSFDASIFEIVMALASGGSLHLGRRESLLPGPPLLEKLRSEAIQIVTLPPSALMNLPPSELPALRTVTVAGEACPAELVERWAPGRRFFNLYGPTEATIWSTFAECTPCSGSPPIGRPIANTRVYILDPDGQQVPVGVPGELCIGGIGLARGYLERPRLTEEKFAAGPVGGRLYRTGDLVRRRVEGDIEFLGRLDFQVKLRGFRIELGEVENALGAHPDVNEVCCVVRTDATGEPTLVAYVVPRGSDPISASNLRGFLKPRLPEFMVPGAFVSLDGFPLMASGKVDRSALPAPEYQKPEAHGQALPVGELEETIASVWRDLLRVDRVGVHDNFFEIGGNSLLIGRANARLTALLARDVPIVDLFRFPTIRALANHLGHVPSDEEVRSGSKVRERKQQSLLSGRARLLDQQDRRKRKP
jgi:amino acid adenylation domain-containing protein